VTFTRLPYCRTANNERLFHRVRTVRIEPRSASLAGQSSAGRRRHLRLKVNEHRRGEFGDAGRPGKTFVFGMLERQGGVMTRIVENVRRATLEPHILANVKTGSTVSTDELKSYAKLARHGYTHGAVVHGAEEWVKGIHYTQGIEGFWSILKRSIRGTHVHVSRKHLAKYLAEFEFRWNLRGDPASMFLLLLKRLET
jgi:transposase